MPTFRFDKGGNALTTSLQVQRLLKVLKALSISLSSYTCNNHKIMTWLHKNLSRKPTFSHIFTITTPILVWKSKMQWKLSHLNSSPWEQNNHHCLRYCPAWKSVNYLLQYKASHDIWKKHPCMWQPYTVWTWPGKNLPKKYTWSTYLSNISVTLKLGHNHQIWWYNYKRALIVAGKKHNKH